MRKSRTRALAAIGAVALLVGLTPAGSGAAALPKVKAKVDVHQVLAGTQQAFTLTVTNPVGATSRVTSVRVGGPVDLFTIAAPADATGWTEVVKNGFVTYTADAGGGIAAGSSRTFGFVADALRPAADRNAAWSVSTSTDPGVPSRYAAADPSTPGALGTRVRTLEVLGIAITAPEQLVGDDSLNVTAGQEDVAVAVRVSNAGSAAQTATVTLAGATATTSTAAPVEIDAGEIVTVPFDVAFGDALGHGRLDANATAGASVASQKFLAYVADEPLELVMDPDNLAPNVVVPGRDVSFTNYLAVRGDDGAPAIDLDPDASEYRFSDGELRVPLGAALHLEAGGGRWLPPTPLVTVPALADGEYGGVLHLEGTDSHGAAVAVDLPFRTGSLTVDSLVPVADIVLSAPDGVAGEDRSITLSGSIVDRDGPCGDCSLRDGEVQLFDAAGAIIDTIDLDQQSCEDYGSPAGGCEDGWTNDEGTVGGAITPNSNHEWPVTATSARLVATVVDDVDLSSTTVTAPIDVDLLAPAYMSATTVDPRTVVVQLSEPVTAPAGFAPGDWTCSGGPVPAATSDADTVVLSLARDLDRNATPTCSYSPIASRAEDRAGYDLVDGSVDAVDGIAPLAPEVDAPAFTNVSTPTLVIGGLNAGEAVAVFEDGFLVGSGAADGSSLDVTTDSLGTNDRVVVLDVEVTDAAGNVGPATEVEITLDFTAPALAAAEIARVGQTRDVTVTFAEPLVGPAAANDWIVYNGLQGYTVSVAISGDTVTLTVSDSAFQPQTMSLNGVAYDVFVADGSTRLTDRAGNIVADAFRTF